MRKIGFASFLFLGFFVFEGNVLADSYYKWVDKKGTIHFSDNRTRKEKFVQVEDGMELLERSEANKRKLILVLDGKILIFGAPQAPVTGEGTK